jgi:hypothetical protein
MSIFAFSNPTEKQVMKHFSVYSAKTLAGLRRHSGLTQKHLVKRLHSRGVHTTQTAISNLELSKSTTSFFILRMRLTELFRSMGYEAQDNGAIIYIPPLS